MLPAGLLVPVVLGAGQAVRRHWVKGSCPAGAWGQEAVSCRGRQQGPARTQAARSRTRRLAAGTGVAGGPGPAAGPAILVVIVVVLLLLAVRAAPAPAPWSTCCQRCAGAARPQRRPQHRGASKERGGRRGAGQWEDA